MVVLPLQHIHMQCHAGRLAEALQAMVDHLRRQIADLGVLEAEVADEERSGGDVDDRARDCLVEGCMGVAEASEALAIAKGLREGFAEAQEGVFDRMVIVNC